MWIKAANMRSSFSKREKTRRNALSLLKRRLISLGRLSIVHGFRRLDWGGTTGSKPDSSTILWVSLPSHDPLQGGFWANHAPNFAVNADHFSRHQPAPATDKMLIQGDHSRQPYEFLW